MLLQRKGSYERSRRRRLQLGLEESIPDLGCRLNVTTQETAQEVGRKIQGQPRETKKVRVEISALGMICKGRTIPLQSICHTGHRAFL